MSRIIIIIPFLILAVGLIFGAHYFVFRSIMFFIKPIIGWVRPALITTFLILGSSFVLSMVMVHFWENKPVRGYYYLAGSWLGIILNLIIFFAVAWLAYWLCRLFLVEPPMATFGWMAIAIAVCVSAMGLWNAYNPQIVKIEVPIKNLPDSWQNKVLVQLSDVHLGAIYGLRYVDRLVRQVNQLSPDMIFITGDLFDGMDGRLDDLGHGVAGLRSAKGTFFITGNHETYLGVDKTLDAIKGGPIKHLADEAVTVDGLTIAGVDFPLPGQRNALTEKIKKLHIIRPAILLYHEPREVSEVAKLGLFDLMLSGHTHRGQLWPFEFIVKAIYGPFAYGLNHSKDFYSYTSVGTGTWGPPMRTEGRSEITVITLVKTKD